MDNSVIQNGIIVFTVLQELRWARGNHKSNDVREFSQRLMDKVQFELDNWEKESQTH